MKIKKSLSSSGAILSFSIALALLLNRLPVYTDEEQWIYINARQYTDHTMQYLFPICNKGFQIDQPIVWYPIRAVLWFLYSHLGLVGHIRIIGVVQAAITILVIRQFLRFYSRNAKQGQTLFFSGVCVGLIPFLIVLNRPEQPLLIMFISALNFTYIYQQSSTHKKKFALFSFLVLMLISMPAIHPKGSLFSLLALSCFILISKNSSLVSKLMITILTLYSAIISVDIWSRRTYCPRSKFLTKTFENITLNPSQFDTHSLRLILGNIARVPKYLINMMYQNSYQSDWLSQENKVSTPPLILANIGVIMIAILLMYVIFTSLRLKSFHELLVDKTKVVVLALIFGFSVLAILQRTKNFYDSYLPAMFLLLGASLLINFSQEKWKKQKVLLLSIALTIPSFLLTAQNFRADSHFNHETLTKKIIKECGISNEQLKEGGFVIGSPMSRTFWDTPRFIYSDYLWGWWSQDVDAEEFIREAKPSVIIVSRETPLRTQKNDVYVEGYVCRNIGNSKP